MNEGCIVDHGCQIEEVNKQQLKDYGYACDLDSF